MTPGNGISPDQLKAFTPFQNMVEHELILMADAVKLLNLRKGDVLFKVGDIDSNEFFLVEGKLELTSDDGKSRLITGKDDIASRPIARLRPRQYTARATGPCVVFYVDVDVLDEIQSQYYETSAANENYAVDEAGSIDEIEMREVYAEFSAALKKNKIVLPSLPEVAIKVRQMLEDENVTADRLALTINADAAIAAKLMRAANSPIYHGASKCDTTKNAIVRLGLRTTQQLVLSFALRDLFQTSSKVMRAKMVESWEQSVEVAAISFVIADMIPRFRYANEEVMLAGLIHDIGIIAILNFIELSPSLSLNPEKAEKAIEYLRRDAGVAILTHWNFPEELIELVQDVHNWGRSGSIEAGLCDVVQVAILHALIRRRKPLPIARIDTLPAFKILPLGELTPELTIEILDKSKEQILAARSLILG